MDDGGQELKNVFVLGTGRCGTVTFANACKHITNWTVGHETNTGRLFEQRFDYADRHIEVDNRLSWLLGKLDKLYGDAPLYIHLHRDPIQTAASYAKRTWSEGLMRAYAKGIILRKPQTPRPNSMDEYALDMVDTITANINLFLKDKSKTMEFSLHNAKNLWPVFWKVIKAQGDLAASLKEWDELHNASE